jgi:hypothetical protein
LALFAKRSPDLALVVERWDDLPEAVRAGMVAMVMRPTPCSATDSSDACLNNRSFDFAKSEKSEIRLYHEAIEKRGRTLSARSRFPKPFFPDLRLEFRWDLHGLIVPGHRGFLGGDADVTHEGR